MAAVLRRFIFPQSATQTKLFGCVSRWAVNGLFHQCNNTITTTSVVAARSALFSSPAPNISGHNLLSVQPSTGMQLFVRHFKDRDVLKLRCKDCYFKQMDGRWYVFCGAKPRHKQRQRMPDPRTKWIITHITHGKKKF